MSIGKAASKRQFTDATRAAALAARLRKRDLAVPKGLPEMFVIRLPAAGFAFGWEIRRFGAVILKRSGVGYVTSREARAAGESALSVFGTDA